MKQFEIRSVYLPFILPVLFFSCDQKATTLAWNTSLYNVGTQSSPRAADLNEDGVLDIVIGAGTAEIGDTDQGIVALDGQSGEVLWKQQTNAQIVGSATFYDITGDGVPEVFIGGRNHNFKALEGKSGAVLWEYDYRFEEDPVLKYARFNFYNSTLLPDQNRDGHPELLTVNGGNWDALPGSSEDRYPGVLMVFNPLNGEIIAADTMPDGKESYMSPLWFQQPDGEEPMILFGTGGETIGGHLYCAGLSDLVNGRLSKARIIATEQTHGFIAPPAIVDVTGDGHYDLVTTSHGGTLQAIDGKTWKTLWKHQFSQMESSNSFAVGNFTGDPTPDLFTVMSKGVWPDYTIAHQLMLDGKTGEIAYLDSLGCFSLASPVACDLDSDGYDEALLSINAYDCNIEFSEDVRSPETIQNQLVFLDFQKGGSQVIDQTKDFRNIYSTPWIGDLDADGYLDIVYCQNYNPNDLFRFLGMSVKRISSSIRLKAAPPWGGYMGSAGDGRLSL